MYRIDIINIVLLVIFLVNTIYGLIVYSRNRKNTTNKVFFILTLTVTFWIVSMFMYRGFFEYQKVIFLAHTLYLAALTIPLVFVYFVSIFPSDSYKFSFIEKYIVPLPFIALSVTSILPGVLIKDVSVYSYKENYILFDKGLHYVYGLYIVGYFLAAHIILLRKYVKATNQLRSQLRSIIIGTVIASLFGVTSNLFLLYANVFAFNWLGQVGIIGMIIPIFYSIVRYKLFNIQVIVTEMLVFILWLFILIRLFFSADPQDQIGNVILLLLTVVIGFFLIRSVRKEVTQREKIEKLAKDLETSNSDLEKANDRLKELDQLKTEFISLATHQIRSPLTAIKGYISLIQEGDYGPVSKEVQGAVDIIFQSTNNLVTIVDDFLNVSRIEQGRMQYDYSDFNLRELVEQVIEEYKPNVEKRGLVLNYANIAGDNCLIHADRGKIKQIIGNVIDNSIKYTPKGSINISIAKKSDKYLIEVSDTGVGIPETTMPKLFQKFSRAENANETNILGTGLGLYVARQLIEAQGGKIWAESEGEGKGASFYVELATK